jgi:hypothetical protein
MVWRSTKDRVTTTVSVPIGVPTENLRGMRLRRKTKTSGPQHSKVLVKPIGVFWRCIRGSAHSGSVSKHSLQSLTCSTNAVDVPIVLF